MEGEAGCEETALSENTSIMNRSIHLTIGIAVGLLIGSSIGHRTASAQSVVTWAKSEVIPIVIVEPSYGHFVPKGASYAHVSWTKDEVTPMLSVQPAYGVFEDGSYDRNTWTKDEVKAYVSVKPSYGQFVPAQ